MKKFTIINTNDSSDPSAYGVFDTEEEAQIIMDKIIQRKEKGGYLDNSDVYDITEINFNF
jgi:hypothetical protein